MTSSAHISMRSSSSIFMLRVHLPYFRISAKPRCSLAAILAWCPKEKRPQRLPCLSVSVLFSPFLNNYLRVGVFQSETGCGKECPSVSSFSCSRIICWERYKKWGNYNTKQTNIRKKIGMFSFVSGLSWNLHTAAFQIVKTSKRDCSSFNNRASNTWLPQTQLLQCN